MNILFLTIAEFDSIYQREIYPDLLREFMKSGHEIYVVSSLEKRNKQETTLINEDCCHILKVKVGNITKSGLIEKGIATIFIESQFKRAIARYFGDIKFDLILYSTPPITLVNAISYVRKRDHAKTYLLLKDIFPQNAVDLGMMSKSGIKGLIYKVFRNKEKKLYRISDYIGCMSQANVDYVLKHNPEINPEKVEICPNCIEVIDKSVDATSRESIRKKYSIPSDKTVFVYGGNLGQPQGIPFLIECLKTQRENKNAYFLVVGDGTEYSVLEDYYKNGNQDNFKLMKRLPKEDYDTLVGACDVGMLFLDHRFTIPNFPSRLLSYMQAKLPVLACTDPNTDVGAVVEQGGFGWWCESNSKKKFEDTVNRALESDLHDMGNNAMQYLKKHYSEKVAYDVIVKELRK